MRLFGKGETKTLRLRPLCSVEKNSNRANALLFGKEVNHWPIYSNCAPLSEDKKHTLYQEEKHKDVLQS